LGNVETAQQLVELSLALVLSAAIGFEREFRQKSAGLRTYTLVGVGAALFMLISKYGFMDVLHAGTVMLDPSRMAAQIVSGIGFLGAGVIFIRRDYVRGLTTAAAIWVTAGVGAAAGAGLPLLAVTATVMFFIVAIPFRILAQYIPREGNLRSNLVVTYPDGHGTLRAVLEEVTRQRFVVSTISTRILAGPSADAAAGTRPGAGHSGRVVQVTLGVRGPVSPSNLAAALLEVPGVLGIVASDSNVGKDDPSDS
jgi:putative Mg2+ transporter-C (MgtC) family protein